MSNLSLVKDAIKTQLDALVTATTLGGATEIDLRKDPFDSDIPSYPHAFLMPPSIESEAVDNRTLLRKYVFAIMIVVKSENITSNTQVEDLMIAVMNRFDNVPTLGGVADGAIEPSTSQPEPLQHNQGQFIIFFVTLRVNKTETLTF